MDLSREGSDGSQPRFALRVHQARPQDRVGQCSEPSGRPPDTGAQLVPQALEEEDFEQTNDARGHAKPWVKELGVQSLEKRLSRAARRDAVGTERADGGEGNRNARSAHESDWRGKQKDSAGVTRDMDGLAEWNPCGPFEPSRLCTVGTARLDRALPSSGEEECEASSQRQWMSCLGGGSSAGAPPHEVQGRRTGRHQESRVPAEEVRSRSLDLEAQVGDEAAEEVQHEPDPPLQEADAVLRHPKVRERVRQGGPSAGSRWTDRYQGRGKASELGDRFCTWSEVPRAESEGEEGQAVGRW